jgi:hypothetical protein
VNIEEILKNVINELNKEWGMEELHSFENNINLFETVDSFSLLSIVIETESALENETGEYIPLADEDLMVDGVSPFSSFNQWVNFVTEKLN